MYETRISVHKESKVYLCFTLLTTCQVNGVRYVTYVFVISVLSNGDNINYSCISISAQKLLVFYSLYIPSCVPPLVTALFLLRVRAAHYFTLHPYLVTC